MTTVREALDEGRSQLAASPSGAPRREAALLLGRVLGWTEAEVLARDDRKIGEDELARFLDLLQRRAGGEPAAYLFGAREFYGREFKVDDRVLVPRPETEHLVEACLELDLPPAPRILDVGVGSGCIAVTLALEIRDARVAATDRSLGALTVARGNARRFATRVGLVHTDLTRGIALEGLDLVVSNPPYVALSDAERLPADVREHEPAEALFGGDDGLETLARLIAGLGALRSATPVVLEIGDGQAAPVIALLETSGFMPVKTVADYSGRSRVVIGRRAAWTGSRS